MINGSNLNTLASSNPRGKKEAISSKTKVIGVDNYVSFRYACDKNEYVLNIFGESGVTYGR